MASAAGAVRGWSPQAWALAAAAGVALASSRAAAGPAPATAAGAPEAPPSPSARARPAPPWPSTADLDGTYVHLGPLVGALRAGGAWDTMVGGEASVVRVREHDPIGVVGGRLVAARRSTGGGRVAAEAVIGTRRPGLIVGLAAGPLVDLGDLHHPRLGASAAIWCYAGVVPYVRIGVIAASDRFVEAGLELPLPVWRHRR